MSATSGITVSAELSSAFGRAVDSGNVRFLKIAIRNESLVPDDSIPPSGTLQEDLNNLGDLLEDNVPAYILVRLDEPTSEWLAVFYVPDTAKVRDKMLYAATRNNLTKSLGSTHITDSIFATSKSDLTADAYAKHKLHMAAPQPMSAREKEIADIRAAEKEAGAAHYEGMRAKKSPFAGGAVIFKWVDEAENAIQEFNNGKESRLVVLTVEPATETLLLYSADVCTADGLGSALPPSEPCFAFFALPQAMTSPPRNEIIFIYSCPSSSPVKHRMLYSSGALSVYQAAKPLLWNSTLATRKVETSDPNELNETYLKTELGLDGYKATSSAEAPTGEVKKPFARPKGPGRR